MVHGASSHRARIGAESAELAVGAWRRGLWPLATLLGLAVAVTSCGGDGGPTEPTVTPGIRVVSGANGTDTISSLIRQPLVVEIGGADGRAARGTVVRFESVIQTDSLSHSLAPLRLCRLEDEFCREHAISGQTIALDTVDTGGRVEIAVVLGERAGRAMVRIVAQELNLVDSVSYSVLPGAATAVRVSARAPVIDLGSSVPFRVDVTDRVGNLRPDTATVQTPVSGAVSFARQTSTLAGSAFGQFPVVGRFRGFEDTAQVRVLPQGELAIYSPSRQQLLRLSVSGRQLGTPLGTNLVSRNGVWPRFGASRGRLSYVYAPGVTFGDAFANGVAVMDASGANLRTIVGTLRDVRMARLVADGSVLVVARSFGSVVGDSLALWRVAPDNAITLVHALPGLASSIDALNGVADISAAGDQVAYVTQSGGGATRALRIVNLTTSATAVVSSYANSPRFTESGDRLVFLEGSPTTPWESAAVPIMINTDGSGRRVLGTAAFAPGFALSPDGAYLLGVAGGGMRVLRTTDASWMQIPTLPSLAGGLDWR